MNPPSSPRDPDEIRESLERLILAVMRRQVISQGLLEELKQLDFDDPAAVMRLQTRINGLVSGTTMVLYQMLVEVERMRAALSPE